MLPAAARLRSGRDISVVMRAGARGWGGDGVSVRLCLTGPVPEASAGPVARVAFGVGKPVGSAVVRNRLRRRLRALTRARLGQLPPEACLVVGADARAAVLAPTELARALDRALAAALRRARNQEGPAATARDHTAGTASADLPGVGGGALGAGVAP